jgi:hypothetical protein
MIASHVCLLVAAVLAVAEGNDRGIIFGHDHHVLSNTTELSGEQNRIVNGQDAEVGRFPYVATLQSVFRHECGGALVAPDLVVTAAHCVDNYLFEVFVGRRSMADPNIERYAVIDKFVHPNYVPNFDSFDIAILKLHMASEVIPVRLNDNPLVPLNENSNLTVLGWGNDGSGYYPDVLQEAIVQYVPNDVCKQAGAGDTTTSYESWLKDDMMCALGDSTDACSGDSGGPLIVKGGNSSEDLLVGTVSWGILCAVYPGVYSRVSFTFDWLSSSICNESVDPPVYLNCGNQLTLAPDTEAPSTTSPPVSSVPSPTGVTNDPTLPPSWPKTLSPTDQRTLAPTTAPVVPPPPTTTAPIVYTSFPTSPSPSSLLPRPSAQPSSISPTNFTSASPSFDSGAVVVPSTSAPSVLERDSQPTSPTSGGSNAGRPPSIHIPDVGHQTTSGGSAHWTLFALYAVSLLSILQY